MATQFISKHDLIVDCEVAIQRYWALNGLERESIHSSLEQGMPWRDTIWELMRLGYITVDVDLDEGPSAQVAIADINLMAVTEIVRLHLSGITPFAVLLVSTDSGYEVMRSPPRSDDKSLLSEIYRVVSEKYYLLSYDECVLQTSIAIDSKSSKYHNIWELIFNDCVELPHPTVG